MIIINILKKIQITSLFNVIYIYIKKLNKKMERKHHINMAFSLHLFLLMKMIICRSIPYHTDFRNDNLLSRKVLYRATASERFPLFSTPEGTYCPAAD